MAEPIAVVPLYEEIAQRMRQHIASRRYPSGKLPSHRLLCRLYQASLPTIKSAIGLLEREGLVVSRPRSGVYVAPAAEEKALSRGMVRCINMFVQPWMAEKRPSWWTVREAYFLGANHAALEAGVQLRIEQLTGTTASADGLLSPGFRPWEQACLFVACHSPESFRSLHDLGVPFVVMTHVRQRRPYPYPNHCRIWVDKADGTAQAVDHLAKLGHTRIGYVGRGYCDEADSWLHEQAPHDGFIEGLRRNGLPVVPEYVHQLIGPVVHGRIADAVRRLMSQEDLPTAIVCGGDHQAIECIELARERGLRVPDDLSVVGMNDQPEAAACDPPLTTMRTPSYEAVKSAIHVLTAPGREPWREPLELVHKCELVVRRTTAPPREER